MNSWSCSKLIMALVAVVVVVLGLAVDVVVGSALCSTDIAISG